MREIRFRAWTDKGTHGIFRMEYDVGVLPMPASNEWIYNPNGLFLKPQSRHILMQFTGLKDNNGKEIYEGDILLWEYGGKFKDQVMKVEFSNGGFGFYDKGWLMLEDLSLQHWEVIGNIWENPELLK